MADNEPFQPAQQRRGTIPAFAAAVLFALWMLQANVPGNVVIGTGSSEHWDHFNPLCHTASQAVVHGWPGTFLRHRGQHLLWKPGDDRIYVLGDHISAWRVGEHPEFSLIPLLVNVAVLIGGTLVVFWLVRRWIARRGYRFGIQDLLVAMIGIALVVGWASQRYRMHRAQLEYMRTQELPDYHVTWESLAPLWLCNLTGSEAWSWGDRLVYVHPWPHQLASVPGKSAIKVVRLTSLHRRSIEALPEFNHLRVLDFSYPRPPTREPVDMNWEECLRIVARCASIESISFEAAGGLSNSDLQYMVALPKLQRLELGVGSSRTEEGFIRSTEEVFVQLAKIKTLRRLGTNGAMSEEGLKKLQQALPECWIE